VQRRQTPAAREAGFTLTELMIVVGVVAILAVIAIPAYTRHVENAHRSEAEANLTALAMLLEQHNALYGLYCPEADCGADNAEHTYEYTEDDTGAVDSDTITAWLRFRPKQATDNAAVRYDYEIVARGGSEYTVRATPAAGRGAPQGKNGGVLTLNQDGAKSYDGEAGW